jgi:hypothetical protein
VRRGEYSLPRLMPHKGDSVIEARRILARQSVFLNLQCAGDTVSLWAIVSSCERHYSWVILLLERCMKRYSAAMAF